MKRRSRRNGVSVDGAQGQFSFSNRRLLSNMHTIIRSDNSGLIRVTADPGGRETGSKFSPLYDAFHCPFPNRPEGFALAHADTTDHENHGSKVGHEVLPASNTDMPNSRPGVKPKQDSLRTLPTEVADTLLAYLSPAALDAVRHTCKFWRRSIMSNHWVLSAVINRSNHYSLHEDRPPVAVDPDGEAGLRNLRNLQQALDQDSYLLSTHLESGTWRPRFRIRNLEITTAEANDGEDPAASIPRFMAAARVGSQYGFMILQIAASPLPPLGVPGQKSILVFFRFDSQDLPLYAGSIEYSGTGEKIDYIGMAEIKPKHRWILKIKVGHEPRYYSIESRTAFSRSEVQFTVTELSCSEVAPQFGNSINKSFAQSNSKSQMEPPIDDQSWKVLASFPSGGDVSPPETKSRKPGGQLPDTNKLKFYHKLRYLAEHVHSGNVAIVVKESTESLAQFQNEDDRGLRGTRILLRPRSDCLYRNIAIAPVSMRCGVVLVAIIWQRWDDERRISELYLYEVPTVDLKSCSSRGSLPASSMSLILAKRFANLTAIQGKRITSLNDGLGGIHPSSPVWDLVTCETTKEKLQREMALGGLQICVSLGNQDNHPRNLQYQKCFVWGPVARRETLSIDCKIFDFSFADRQRLQLMLSHGIPIREVPEHLRSLPGMRHSHCACGLHDDGFRVVLPPFQDLGKTPQDTTERPAKRRASSFWPWKCDFSLRADEPLPVITQNDSAARQEALLRQAEWFMERTRCMKRAGLSDWDIAELWGCARWTQYGQIRKPEGWQCL